MFNVIGTGSKGNCFTFGNLMIDLGLPYDRIKNYLGDVTYILLTHRHNDHLNLTTLRKVIANTNATFVCGWWLKEYLPNDKVKIVEAGRNYELDDYRISPVIAYHDAPNFGYRIMKDGHKHFHITDTATLDGITARGYDSASIECNHCEIRARELIQEAKEKGEFTHLEGAMNSHLSVQKAIDFCRTNGIKNLIPVHVGESTKSEVLKALRIWDENLK
ncbi:MAG: MBL fold metallo-hydrolase [Campylobacteraceae bacterium]|jgi:phosphoribosyl 1,2-cyclic phosphodiesterase|nr:MBL fold metallo-hydrolase [Campylobacteraceae bacterium]